jgi:hypothetical protein
MKFRRLSVFLAALALATGIGVGAAVADGEQPPSGPCVEQAGQHGMNEDQATANTADAVSSAAVAVQEEANTSGADDVAGDQHGAADANEAGEANQCGVDENGVDGTDGAGEGDHAGDNG